MRSSLRNTILFLSFLAVILAAFIYGYLYYQSRLLVDKTLTTRRIVSITESSKAQDKDVQELYDSTASARKSLPTFFVPVKSGVVFIQAIETIGEKVGADMNIGSIKETAAEKDSKIGVGYISAEVSANGTWVQIMKMVELFETMPYLVDLNNLNLSVTSAGDGKNEVGKIWHLGMTVTALTFNESFISTTTKK